MDELTFETWAARLAHLEQECGRLKQQARLWKRAGGVVLAAVIVVTIVGAGRDAVPKTIEAERFVLRGKHAEELVRLEEIPDEGPSLTFFDHRGKQRINMMIASDGKASVGFFDRHENPRIGFGLQANGLAGLSFIGQDGKERGGMSINADGSVALGLFDNEGRPRVRLSSNADGTPHLTLLSESGKKRLGLDVAPAGEAILSVLDSQGVVRLSIGIGKDGNLWQGARDKEGRFVLRAIEP
jgi:hypothetical protein